MVVYMELRQLEYFIAVCELKSFTKAAQKLYVSQPTITSAINVLEKELHVKLFVRSGRQFALTMEGAVFYNHVKLVMQDVNIAIRELDSLAQTRQQSLKIAVDAFIYDYFISAYSTFMHDYTHAKLYVHECSASSALSLLSTESVDAALVLDVYTFDNKNDDSCIALSPLSILCPSDEHIDLQYIRKWIEENNSISIGNYSPALKKLILSWLNISETNILFEFNNMHTTIQTLKCLPLISILPEICLKPIDGYIKIPAPSQLCAGIFFRHIDTKAKNWLCNSLKEYLVSTMQKENK